jgi:pimeloyl-ACP methyl ester carboxylesterase
MYVNGIFLDVEGLSLVRDADGWRERPTVILVHGGPGGDHTSFKPEMFALARSAQVIYLDLRGSGRSVKGNAAEWNLRVWTDDLLMVCDALGIERPVLLGQSFGTLVAMRLAIDYPDRAAGMILASPYATGDLSASYPRFEALGGIAARRAAEDFWQCPSQETLQAYRALCAPLYPGRRPSRAQRQRRDGSSLRLSDDVLLHHVSGEHRTLDLRAELGQVVCPTLILAGRRDPLTPPSLAAQVASSMPANLVESHVLAKAGHHVFKEARRRSLRIVMAFLSRLPVESKTLKL